MRHIAVTFKSFHPSVHKKGPGPSPRADHAHAQLCHVVTVNAKVNSNSTSRRRTGSLRRERGPEPLRRNVTPANRAGSKASRGTLDAAPSTMSSAMANPVAGALRMPQQPCPVATNAPSTPGTLPMTGVPSAASCEWQGLGASERARPRGSAGAQITCKCRVFVCKDGNRDGDRSAVRRKLGSRGRSEAGRRTARVG
eukprot:3042634-Rhodomonas_salina.4